MMRKLVGVLVILALLFTSCATHNRNKENKGSENNQGVQENQESQDGQDTQGGQEIQDGQDGQEAQDGYNGLVKQDIQESQDNTNQNDRVTANILETQNQDEEQLPKIISSEDASRTESIVPTQSITSMQSETPIHDNTDTTLSNIRLTEQFLEGVWVNEFGFVCEYIDGKFIDPNCTTYDQCNLTESGIEGVNSLGVKKSIELTIINEHSIKINGVTAYHANSSQGKKYVKAIQKGILGSWYMVNYGIEACHSITENKWSVISCTIDGIPADDLCDESDIEFCNAKLIIKYENPYNDEVLYNTMFIKLNGDKLSLLTENYKEILYRDRETGRKNFIQDYYEIDGKWINMNDDWKQVEIWEFNSDEKTIDRTLFMSNEKMDTLSYKISFDGKFLKITIDGTEYYYTNRLDNLTFDNRNKEINLMSYESQDTQDIIKKLEIVSKNGHIEKRTFEYACEDGIISSVILDLECKNNILLENEISVSVNNNTIDAYRLGGFYINTDLELKNATISVQYNQKNMLYDYEDDLCIGYNDLGGGFTLLKTTIDKEKDTLSVPYIKDAVYMIVDRYIYDGGERQITKQNPASSDWAKLCYTGDILELVDLDYIEKSQGYFEVSTPEQLASVVYYVNTMDGYITIELMNDIDLSQYQWASMGWSCYPISHSFSGVILGNNHKLIGLHMEDNGLIGWEVGCLVEDLIIQDAVINGNGSTAILSGEAIGGSYINCKISGTVTGNGSTGSMLGHAAHAYIEDCTADVIVNGEKFNFLTYNEKAISEIKVDNLIEITMSDDYTIHRPEVSEYENLAWVIIYNGREVLSRNAENELSYQYYRQDTGDYECYLEAWVEGQYVPVSNVIKYTIQ